MCFSLTAITWRLMEGANGTSINTNPLIYMCEVRTRREDDIKKEREVKKGGEKEKETLEHSVIKFVTKLKNNI